MTSNFKGAIEASIITKSCGITTVVGGPNLEAFPEETLSHYSIDYGIIGEGEIAFSKLVEAIENKNSIDSIEGLVYKENGAIKYNSPAIIDDIDTLPFPARHLLPMSNYTSIISVDPMTTMITSRGCPYKCSFCYKQFSDTKVRFRNPLSVVDEMEFLVKRYNVKEIMFYDDTILLKQSHVEGICNEILRRNLKVRWESPSRVDRVNLPLLELMKASGCVRLRYGVESGDKNILRAMNKQINPEMVIKAFELTRQAGIETFAYFMTGYMNETRMAFENTLELIGNIRADQVMITLATPYPKTLLEKQAIEAGKMPADYWRNFVLGEINSPLPPLVDGSEEWIKELYHKFYFNPVYIFNRLRRIRSLNQLKKHLMAGIGLILFKTR